MEYTYTLQANDFLQHQLFIATQSNKIAKKKKLGWLSFSSVAFCFAIYCYLNNSTSLALYFGGIAIVWFMFYPKYFMWKHYKHYNTYINANYKERINKTTSITLSKSYITATDETGEGKIKTSEIKGIAETTQHIFIQFKNGSALIIPKRELNNVSDFKTNLTQIGLNISNFINWKWVIN